MCCRVKVPEFEGDEIDGLVPILGSNSTLNEVDGDCANKLDKASLGCCEECTVFLTFLGCLFSLRI